MQRRHIISVSIDDDPEAFARLTDELALENINIEGFSTDRGMVRLVTDNPRKTLGVDRALGLHAATEEVFCLEVPNEVGRIAHMNRLLADIGVQIEAAFGYSGNQTTGIVLVIPDDIGEAAPLLERFEAARTHYAGYVS